jgi:hypothetical protein
VPLAALFSLLLFAFNVGISHWLAKALGGDGTYDALAFATAAYFAPSLLLGAIVSMIPYAGVLSIALWVYYLLLNVVAVKAVHHFSWGRALVPSAVLVALNAIAVACVVIVSLADALAQAGT